MLEPSANMPWFKGWKVTVRMAMPVEPRCLRLWTASYHQLVQLTSLAPASPGCLQNLVFSNPVWWSPLLQSTLQRK
uniref:Uncharacterized protein n=1 Tax=Homo sapiens TaxID=9606 RepID=A0A4D5RA83_HUMAN